MSAYIFVELLSDDREKMAGYREKVAATIFSHGGKYHFRGKDVEVMESDLFSYGGDVPSTVLIEFSDKDAARRWYFSDEYQAILPERLANSRANCLLIEGTVNIPGR